MPRYFKETRPDYNGERVIYHALANQPDPSGETPSGEITAIVRDGHTFPNFDFGPSARSGFRGAVTKEFGVSEKYVINHPMQAANAYYANDAAIDVRNYRGSTTARSAGIKYAKHIRNIKKDKDFEPTELFTTTPKSVEVTSAFVDPSLKSSFLTMGALLHQEHGVPITASDYLSKWSSSVSRNAQKRGLPVVGHENNPDMDKTNDIADYGHYPMTKARYEVSTIERNATPVPEHEIKGARQHLRSMLGHPPKDTTQHLSSQFAQPSFPGMENY
jgi:hypothetical protein